MIQKVLNTIINGNSFLCIEVLLEEGKTGYHVIDVKNKDNSLSIESSVTYADFDELTKNLPKNKPTLLSFTGQGIISKRVEHTANYRSKILFNANADEFYWYELPQTEYIYTSVIRKSIVDNELEAFHKNQIFIVDFSIGPFVISAMKQLLPKINSLYTKNYKLDYEGDTLSGFAKQLNEDDRAFYEIEGEKISLKDSIPFANLLNYLFPNPEIESEKDFLEQNKQEFGFRKAFNSIGMIALPAFLLALLVSYFLLNHYQSEFIALQVQLEEKNITYNKLVLLEKDRSNKEAMLSESGLNNSNFLSFYLSEITREIPLEINLTELNLFSPDKKIKPGERIVFNNDEVKIKGTTVSNSAFSSWIKTLKKYPWIKNLEIVDFRKDGNTNNFEILLKLKFDV